MKNTKTEGKGVAITTRQVKAPARKQSASKAAEIVAMRDVAKAITTRDVKRKK